MNSLFDKFQSVRTPFRPSTARELFVLRLAQKLDDVKAVSHYLTLAQQYSDGQLLAAYRRVVVGSGDRGRLFHAELERIHSNGNHERQASLISIRVERRSVGVVVFRGDQLEYTDARQLSSAHEKALGSALGFINWMLNHFSVESAAVELIPSGQFQRRVLHDAVCHTLRDRLLPLWEIPMAALLEGCGYPTLKARRQLREVATDIWPILEGTHAKVFIQDAAILGLHVQTERQFIIN
jgi:hypothetical protein